MLHYFQTPSSVLRLINTGWFSVITTYQVIPNVSTCIISKRLNLLWKLLYKSPFPWNSDEVLSTSYLFQIEKNVLSHSFVHSLTRYCCFCKSFWFNGWYIINKYLGRDSRCKTTNSVKMEISHIQINWVTIDC